MDLLAPVDSKREPAPSEVVFKENIRLVVWDLDDTYWAGTLTEGGVTYLQENHDLVISLARRGIMSSICSKNDFDVIKAKLQEAEIWDYFIFPSINWTPKAPRLKAMVEAVGLRPPTILFIDDNWQNLHQVASLLPEINIAEPSLIPFLGSHNQLIGKNDEQLTRLNQYKSIEIKQRDLEGHSGEHIDFLRGSDIRVYFEYEVEKHLDRVIELINRTNQLNFTKKRLPENLDEAKAALLPFLRHNGTTPGLIRVVDRYGDYGFVGFYAMTDLARVYTLRYFCFSCRTINMYIEHFVYNYLGRPQLEVVGDVLSNVKTQDVQHIDWIKALPIDSLQEGSNASVLRFKRIYARGGCDLMALMHYFSLHSDDIVQEFNTLKNWQPLRLDHSAFLLASINGLTDAQHKAASGLGYDAEDFRTVFPSPCDQETELVFLSFWADADIPFYRHRETGLELPYWVIGTAKHNYLTDEEVIEKHSNAQIRDRILNHLRPEWGYVPCLTHDEMVVRYRSIVQKIPAHVPVVMTLANDRDHAYFYSPLPLSVNIAKRAYNIAVQEAVRDLPNVKVIDFRKYVEGPDDILDMNHLRRDIYVTIYNEIMSLL